MAEKRLIDANFLKKRLDDMEVRNGHKYYRAGMDDALHDFMPQLIDEQPTVDAVEVVRCRECEHWNTEEKSYFGTKCRCERFSLVGYSENYVLPNDFCSYGERRTDG